MKYRIVVTFAVDEAQFPYLKALWDNLMAKKDLARLIDDFVEVHKCYHDEEPYRPCEVVYRWTKASGQ